MSLHRSNLARSVLAILIGIGFAHPGPALAKHRGDRGHSTSAIKSPASDQSDPEILLIEIYKELASHRLHAAQIKADKLVQLYPNFRLGQLIRGDLLLMHTRPMSSFGPLVNGPQDGINNLRDEAIVRLKALTAKPDPNLIPRPLLQLRSDQKNVLVVDTKRSRLYVYANQNGQPKLITDYYISQGKLGVNKLIEGDQKTPLGVYYITSRLPKAKLPDFYGAGALPLNYPNDWDKINGRTGSGIWLHGTPSDNFSRPPLSSDGCVVLTNPDLEKLSQSIEVGKTSIVISDGIEFVQPSKREAERKFANELVEAWRIDSESLDVARMARHYSARFRSSSGDGLRNWLTKHQPILAGNTGHDQLDRPVVRLRDLSLFLYPGKEEMIMSTFNQETVIGKRQFSARKRQYWVKEAVKAGTKENQQWKIIAEVDL